MTYQIFKELILLEAWLSLIRVYQIAINIGDFIELNGGPAGNVIEVGWRSTKIRTIYNNLVVIPNSVLADTIVTNYQSPNDARSVIVGC